MLWIKDVSISHIAALGLLGLALTGCASADVSAIKKASDVEIQNVRVSEIVVKVDTAKPNPALQAALEEELGEKLPLCATGAVDHRMDVTINDFEEANVGQTIFLGDEIELEGRVELTELAGGQKIGEYYVQRSFFWGGVIGAAMMSDPEASLSEGFTESVCKEVFATPLQ